MTVNHWYVSVVSGLLLRKGACGSGHKPSPGIAAVAFEIWQSRLPVWLWMQRMDSKAHLLQSHSSSSWQSWGPETLQLVHDENSASLLLTREERVLLVKLRCVWGNFVYSAELKSMSEVAAGTCPLGRQRLRTCQQGGSWRRFLGKLTWTYCCPRKWGWQRRRRAQVFLN